MSGLNRLKRLVESLVTYTVAGEWLKFTEDQSSTPAIGQYISALSNAAAMAGYKNGYIVWGVEESNREVVGTDFAWRRNQNGEPLAQWLARQVSPDVGFRFYEVSVRVKRVVALEIPAARGVPTSFAGERWICIGSSTEKLSKYPERESQIFEVLRHGLPSVENTPTSYQNLTFTQLFTYFAGQGVELTRESFRANLKLLTADGRYNLLAQLLSDDSRIPIRFSVFAGTTKTAPLYTVREFGNACLLVSINKVLDYGEVLNVPQLMSGIGSSCARRCSCLTKCRGGKR